MKSFTVQSTSRKFLRKTWYLPATSKPPKIAIFLDAEIYLDQMDTERTLLDLQQAGTIPPIACLFVSSRDQEARHHDYTCSDPYADFIAKDLIPWTQRQSGIASQKGHLIAGVSLSGLQSIYTSLSYPEIFPLALSQSGSFWWENEWFARHLREFSPSEGRYWISVGTREKGAGLVHPPTDLLQEIDQDIAIRNISAALKQHGCDIHDHIFEGGHAAPPWKAELPHIEMAASRVALLSLGPGIRFFGEFL